MASQVLSSPNPSTPIHNPPQGVRNGVTVLFLWDLYLSSGDNISSVVARRLGLVVVFPEVQVVFGIPFCGSLVTGWAPVAILKSQELDGQIVSSSPVPSWFQ